MYRMKCWRPSLYSFDFFDSPIESNPLTAGFIYLFIYLVLIFLPIIRFCFFSVLVFLLSIFYLVYFLFLVFIQFFLFLFNLLPLNYLRLFSLPQLSLPSFLQLFIFISFYHLSSAVYFSFPYLLCTALWPELLCTPRHPPLDKTVWVARQCIKNSSSHYNTNYSPSLHLASGISMVVS